MMAMSQHSGVSVGEVAGEFIYHFDQPGENPVFYRQDPATLVMSESDGAFMRSILNSIVQWGLLHWPDSAFLSPDELDEFGWNRHDMGIYLLVFMGHLPDCCDPDWEPCEALGNSPVSNLLKSSSNSECETTIDYEGDRLEIKGALYSSLQRAIRAFPITFPGYKEEMPMAKVVKGWIKDSGIETTDRPAQVLATMVIENFSSDT